MPDELELLETLRFDSEYILSRGRHSGSSIPVLILAQAEAHKSQANLKRLEHEYALRSQLDATWSARPIALSRQNDRMTLILDDPGGEPLERLVGKPMATGEFLHIAVPLAVALGLLHERGLVHKDIKPANVLVDAVSGGVWLTGFGMASRVPRERPDPEPPAEIAGTLAYMAPEQTGRMNRSIDSRSDLYSLGVTFYEMLTGTLPFRANDPMEWIHCHIARQPLPPSDRVIGVPPQLSALVMKLLAKTADERYQTAAGLAADLRSCVAASGPLGEINRFLLGTRDISDRLLIPERLYGRERDIRVLFAAFDRVVAHGSPELLLVHGYSGVGKSSLVNELHKALVSPRAFFAAGKFDQHKRDIPYMVLAESLQSLVRQVLVKRESELAEWRADLIDVLGSNGQVIVNLIPEVEFIIGPQPPVPNLQPQDAKNHFQMVFRRFLCVFATQEHPLVLFLDDLQWADIATLELIEHLITHSEVRYLLLVGSYRDNEVSPSHPLTRTLDTIHKTKTKMQDIVLAPLGSGDVRRLISDTLHCDPERARPLAKLVHEKTGGNPFFAIQFLIALADERLLAFDPVAAAWAWDIPQIRARNYSDNVADLMVRKLKQLSSAAQAALRCLACLGNMADIGILTLVQGGTEEAMHAALWEAVHTGLIVSKGDAYRFPHDRIQQAAYSLLPEGCRASVHLHIGRMLLAKRTAAELDEQIFEIANQFNRGATLLVDPEERAQVADLELSAGRKAKRSAAYASAHIYLASGVALLDESDWCNRYDLRFNLLLERAECEFMNGDLGSAEQLITELLRRATRRVDQAAGYALRVQLLLVNGKYSQAVDSALTCLRLFGIDLPTHPTWEQVQGEYNIVCRHLQDRSIESLIDLPDMTDAELKCTMRLLSALNMPAYFTDYHLYCICVCRMVCINMLHGASDYAANAFSVFGFILGPVFHRYSEGYCFAKLACDLVETRGILADQAKTHLYLGAVAVWTRPLTSAIDSMRSAFRIATETGDLTYAPQSAAQLISQRLVRNDLLEEVWLESQSALEFAQKAGFRDIADIVLSQQRLIANLQGRTASFSTFNGAGFDETEFEARLTDDRMLMLISWYWIFKMQARVLSGNYHDAIAAAGKANAARVPAGGLIQLLNYAYYKALTVAALFEDGSADEQAAWSHDLATHVEQLREWAANYPPTFTDKHALVAAEIARLEGRVPDAQRLYEEAIRAAGENGFSQNEGLSYEVAARFYARQGLETISRDYLRHARGCYLRWGADGKVRQLESKYPFLVPPAAAASDSTIDTPIAQLDLATVVKVSQAVSGEIDFNKLIEILVETALEHAGGTRGVLILRRGEEMWVEAEATIVNDTFVFRRPQIRVAPSALPESVFHYVTRTKNSVLLDDASVQRPYSADEYVRQNNSRSILCLPLVKQTKLIGVLYLENQRASHVFTPARIAVLRLLASQAATSLENARLYSDLRTADAYLAEAQRLSRTGSFGVSPPDDELYWSDEAFRIFEYDRTVTPSVELILRERVHPEDVAEFRRVVERGYRLGQDYTHEYRLRMPDGRVKYLHVATHAVPKESGDVGFVGAVMDVTTIRLAELELQKTQTELAHAARMTSLGELTASIAHEINQPLMAIVTNAETCLLWLKKEKPNLIRAQAAAERIVENGYRAGDVIRSIRTMARKAGPEMVKLDINQVIRDTLNLMQSELQRHEVSLKTRLSAAVGFVEGDRTQLQQVIVNLIMNALEAMRVSPGAARVLHVATESNGNGSVLTMIEDSGSGVDSQLLERIFDPMFTTKSDGMGLGLSICRTIIEGHGGRLWVSPNPSGGSTFQFTVPGSTNKASLEAS